MFADEYSYKNTVALFIRIELTEKLYSKVALFGKTKHFCFFRYVYNDRDREDRDRELAEDCCLLACCWATLCCCLAANT